MIATGNPGCIMQLRLGVQQAGLDIAVVHPIELLDASYQAGGEYGGKVEERGVGGVGEKR